MTSAPARLGGHLASGRYSYVVRLGLVLGETFIDDCTMCVAKRYC